MKNIIAITVCLLFISLSCIAQCEKLDSYDIDNFLTDQKKIEESKKQSPKINKNKQKSAVALGVLTISGGSGSNFYIYPNILMTLGVGFSEGLAKITVNEESGFINRSGQIAIKPKYRIASCFSEGLAAVQINKKWGFINQKGAIIIPAKFDAAANFSEGLALVKVGEFWGYVSQNGELAIAPTYEEAGSFSEGFAVIGYYNKDYVWTSHTATNGKWQRNFIDKKGKLKFPSSFDGISRNFDGGMALVSRNIGYKNGVVSQSYFIDLNGKELWKWDSNLNWFSEDLIVVSVNYDRETKLSKYSFLDRNGKRVTENVYDTLSEFSEGLAVASINDKSGFINKTGAFVIEPKFSSAGGFSEGLADVYKDGKSGFIDTLGNWKIKLKFDWTDEFKDGRAAVAVGEKVGYINRNGEYIWKPTK